VTDPQASDRNRAVTLDGTEHSERALDAGRDDAAARNVTRRTDPTR
jgi:hypothetical protein